MKKIALNYIYLSKEHAGGKDQVGINLLKGFYENGYTRNMFLICYDYSLELVRSLAPDITTICIKSRETRTELARMLYICYVNTIVIPRIVKQYQIDLVYHISCNTGLRKTSSLSVVIPHDIKAVSHRVLADVKIPLYKYFLHKVLYYIDFRTNDKIIAISDTDQKEISRFYPKFSNKIKRIYNPIDVKLPKSYKRNIKNYIVALNLQFHHKNIITLIKAFELIRDQIEDNLILVGSLPERMCYLKEYVDDHLLGDRVIFTGFVDEGRKRSLFEESRLYVNPTLYEGFGMTAVEAIILGIPTLVSKIETNYEVTRGLCFYYYPPENERELANAILNALKRDCEYSQIIKASHIIYDAYNYTNISRQYIHFFESL